MGIHRWYPNPFGFSRYSRACESYRGKPKMFIADHLQKLWCGNPGHTEWWWRNTNHLNGEGKQAGGNVMVGDGSAEWKPAEMWEAFICMNWPHTSDTWAQVHGWNNAWPFGTGGTIDVRAPTGESAPNQTECYRMWGYRPEP